VAGCWRRSPGDSRLTDRCTEGARQERCSPKGDRRSPLATAGRLTPRERENVQLIAEGRSSKDVANLVGLSVKTADAHRANIMRKLDLHSVSELVMYAVRNKIVQA
jgi:DNA-binding CsgD family transcriptional regulator